MHLVGRSADVERIGSFLRGSLSRGASLLLSGEAGAGKTALLHHAARDAQQLGMRVVPVSGVEFEADIGFGGLSQILQPLREDFPCLEGRHRTALEVAIGLIEGPAVDRLLVSTAMHELVRLVAAKRPVMLIVDDAQWLDTPTAHVLGFLLRRVQGMPAAIIAACRPGTAPVFEGVAQERVDVQPLDEKAAQELLDSAYPELNSTVRHRLVVEAQGNPLALLELPNALTTEQRSSASSLPMVLPLNRRILDLYAARLTALPADTRWLLLLAVLDGGNDVRSFAQADAAAHPWDLSALAPAQDARLVVEDGERLLRFRHPLIRSAIVELASAQDRRRAHEVLAQAWDQHPERHVWHLAQATIGPDEYVAQMLDLSSRRILRRGDAVGAATALTRAADLSPAAADRSRRLAEAAYIGSDVTGQLERAGRLLTEASRVDNNVARSWQSAVTEAHLLFYGDGEVDGAHRLLINALDQVPGPLPADDEFILGALHTLLMVCWSGGREELWPPLRAALNRLHPGPPEILAICVETISDPARLSLEVLDRLDLQIAALSHEHESTRVVRTGLAAINVHRTTDCRDAYARVQRDGREGGAITSAIKAMAIMSTEDFWTGRWEDAEREATEALQYCTAYGYTFLVYTAKHTLAMLAAARGDAETATALADEMTRWAAPRRSLAIQRHAVHARLLLALGNCDFEDAYRLASSISPPGVLSPYVPQAVVVGLDLVESALRCGRREDAHRHTQTLVHSGIERISPKTALLVRTAQAMIADDDDDAAQASFAAALSLPGIDRWPFEVARTQLAYGERLRRMRANKAARPQLSAALQTFRNLGAQPWCERANNELRAAGHQPSTAPTADLASIGLTSREQEISLLAASGLTNKQIGERLFLSPRTVGYHLHRIFPRLGVTTRAALSDALSRSSNEPTAQSPADE